MFVKLNCLVAHLSMISIQINTSNSQKELKSNLNFYYNLWESSKGVYILSIEENILTCSSFFVHLAHCGRPVCHSLSILPKHPQTSSQA